MHTHTHTIYVLHVLYDSKLIPQQPVALGNLSPIMDAPEFDEIDMDVG